MKNFYECFHDETKSKTYAQTSPLFLNVSKKILARESIFRNMDCNIPLELKKKPNFLTQQQIKMSSIYQKLLQRIQKAKQKEEQERRQFNKRMQSLSRQIKEMKADVQEDKVEMWQLKNQIMELEELLNEEVEEYQHLCEEMQVQQEDGEQLDEDQVQNQDSQQYGTGTDQQNYQGTQSQNSNQESKEQQSYSKPSCSIKYFISNRSITSPNFSNKNIETGEGRGLLSETDYEEYTQLFIREQRQGSNTDNRIMSFKKTEQPFCLNE